MRVLRKQSEADAVQISKLLHSGLVRRKNPKWVEDAAKVGRITFTQDRLYLSCKGGVIEGEKVDWLVHEHPDITIFDDKTFRHLFMDIRA